MIKKILFVLFLISQVHAFGQIEYSRVLILMGTRFEITAISDSEENSKKAVNAGIREISRIESLISSWDENSQTSSINRKAGKEPVKVDKELFDLIYRSQKISNLTQGAFDISFASIEKLWKFDGSMTQLPSPEEIERSVRYIDFRNIILDKDNSTVFLKNEGMRIGFGAIGKGYAANRARKVMEEMGIEHGVVNAAGDLTAWGTQGNGEPWKVGISKPDDLKTVIDWLTVSDNAVVTSGDYEKFVELEGRRYSHIIDPRTGYPTTGIKSVTIICPDAELADGLATSVFVMGPEKGLALINLLKGIECLIITDDNKLITSQLLDLNYYDASTDPGEVIPVTGK